MQNFPLTNFVFTFIRYNIKLTKYLRTDSPFVDVIRRYFISRDAMMNFF